MLSQNRQFATRKSVSFTRPLLRHASQTPGNTVFQPFRNQRGPDFQPESASRLDLAAENRTNASITAEPWQDRTAVTTPGTGLQQKASKIWRSRWPFQSAPSQGYFSEEFGQSM
jgi:hypothetical protein